MHGIEILNSREVVVKEKFNWKWFFIMFSLMIIISFVLLFFDFTAFDVGLSTMIPPLIYCVIWGIISGFFVGDSKRIPVEYAMEYKIAILDESVRDRVFEKYEVIKIDEKLWTVREKC